jgi:outer membrane receptor protein involved in Fe transport
VGYRFYRYDNSIDGFFGFGANQNYSSGTGEKQNNDQANPQTCVKPGILGGPCVNLAQEVKDNGTTPKFNLTYKVTDDAMIYATFSKGFRPGGVNRRIQPSPNPPLATYKPDFLTNYELGYKTSWLDNHLRFNGAFFVEDWKDIQFGFLGYNSFTTVRNAGAARIKGAEQELEWAPVTGLNLHLAATELDPKMTQDFCYDVDPATGLPYPQATCPAADFTPSGTQLPIVPKFKANATARYSFPVGSHDMTGYGQAAYSYTSQTRSELSPIQNDQMVGSVPAYGILDLALGLNRANLQAELFASNALNKNAETYRFAECTIASPVSTGPNGALCGTKPLAGIVTPRTIGIRFSQSF